MLNRAYFSKKEDNSKFHCPKCGKSLSPESTRCVYCGTFVRDKIVNKEPLEYYYEYLTIPIFTPLVDPGTKTSDALAEFFQYNLNKYAKYGWEFVCTEIHTISEKKGCGCLLFFIHTDNVENTYKMLVFKRKVYVKKEGQEIDTEETNYN